MNNPGEFGREDCKAQACVIGIIEKADSAPVTMSSCQLEDAVFDLDVMPCHEPAAQRGHEEECQRQQVQDKAGDPFLRTCSCQRSTSRSVTTMPMRAARLTAFPAPLLRRFAPSTAAATQSADATTRRLSARPAMRICVHNAGLTGYLRRKRYSDRMSVSPSATTGIVSRGRCTPRSGNNVLRPSPASMRSSRTVVRLYPSRSTTEDAHHAEVVHSR